MLDKIRRLKGRIHIFCLCGPGGSGKRLHGALVTALLPQTKRFEMSDLIHTHQRHAADSVLGTKLLKQRGVETLGDLYDDEPVLQIFDHAIHSFHSKRIHVPFCDGFPRHIKQAQELINSRVTFSVIYLIAAQEIATGRIMTRARFADQSRVDDKAVGRYNKAVEREQKMLDYIMKYDDKAVMVIDTSKNDEIINRIGKMLKFIQYRNGGFLHYRWKDVMSKLNNPQHEASKILNNVKAERDMFAHHPKPAHLATAENLVSQNLALASQTMYHLDYREKDPVKATSSVVLTIPRESGH